MHRAEITTSRTGIIYWFFTVSYMGIIFYLSSLEGADLPDLPQNFDKLLHMSLYFILGILFNLSLYKSGFKKYVFMLAFLFAALYGITDETHQAFVSERDATIGDVIADSLGSFLGSLLASAARDRR
jgi:VanZ family protein